MILINLHTPRTRNQICPHGVKGKTKCLPCKNAYRNEWRKGDKAQTHLREWREKNKEKMRAYYTNYARVWNKKNPGASLLKHRLRRGIKNADLCDVLLRHQGGKCAVCLSTEPGGRGTWHADHDHETGLLRGMLCTKCNQGVGYFQDSPDLLRSAASYLESPPANDVRAEQEASAQ